jgi:hypothetical protein
MRFLISETRNMFPEVVRTFLGLCLILVVATGSNDPVHVLDARACVRYHPTLFKKTSRAYFTGYSGAKLDIPFWELIVSSLDFFSDGHLGKKWRD